MTKKADIKSENEDSKALLVRMPRTLHNRFKVWTATHGTTMQAELFKFITSRIKGSSEQAR